MRADEVLCSGKRLRGVSSLPLKGLPGAMVLCFLNYYLNWDSVQSSLSTLMTWNLKLKINLQLGLIFNERIFMYFSLITKKVTGQMMTGYHRLLESIVQL